MTFDQLNTQLDRLNDLNFGWFSCWEIENPNKLEAEQRIYEYLNDYTVFKSLRPHMSEVSTRSSFEALCKDLENFKLHPVDDHEALIRQKTQEWLAFRGPYAPEEVDQAAVNALREEVLEIVLKYVRSLNITEAYHIDESFVDYFTPWGDQLSFDIVCCSADRIFIYHTGWSS